MFDTAEAVLSKPDPALELPADERWMAAVYGKVREESGVVIGSILDSVMKLSVYAEGVGDQDLMDGVDRLVNRLLDNASADRWLSLSGYVREIAEAAPRQFLRAINAGLAGNPPPLRALFAESEADPMFHRSSHTSLLWALEVLAWSPRHLAPVCDALARMMAFPVRPNLSNRPSNSLISLLRPWWPQTTASAQVRLGVLDRLIARHPEAAWEVVASSIPTGSMWASPNATPHWRDDDAGSPNPNQFDDSYASELGRRCLDLACGQPVRELLEDPAADAIRNGFVCGVRNNRGVHSRGIFDGGLQERALADKYRALAQPLLGTFPMTAECLLDIARGYDFEARTYDDEADMMREHP